MGDGVLDPFNVLGFNDVALPAIFAHEFGHHIQYERGYFDELPPGSNPATVDAAELTRYTELMADAFAGYYLTHKRGATLNRKRVEKFLEVFFQLGDCQFTSAGHHGTPIQRMRAARFGFDVADQAQKQGHIPTADEFHAAFVAAYPDLIAPDAT
jgi:predicted metalloprotease